MDLAPILAAAVYPGNGAYFTPGSLSCAAKAAKGQLVYPRVTCATDPGTYDTYVAVNQPVTFATGTVVATCR